MKTGKNIFVINTFSAQSVYYNYSIMEKLIQFQIFTINIFPLLKINQKRLRRIIKLLVYRNIT